MAGLLGLPNELLLKIADRLQHDGPTSHTNSTVYKDLTARSAREGPTRIARFTGTLLNRPDLAGRVKILRLKTTSDPPPYSSACASFVSSTLYGCNCGWKETVDLCRTFLETTKTESGLSLLDRSWIYRLEDRYESALAGLILFFTPAVRILTLELQRKRNGPDTEDYWRDFDTEHIELYQLFGALSEHPKFAIEQVTGLSNVTKIFTAGWIPSSIIALPRLKTARLTLLNHQYKNAPLHLRPHTDLAGLTLSTTLKRLTVRLDVSVAYSSVVPGTNTIHAHFGTTMKGLTSLTHLYLQLTSSF
jgi:hypothetical protein